MKRDVFAWQKLQPLSFSDFNLMHEGQLDIPSYVLSPRRNQISDIVNNYSDIICDIFKPRMLFGKVVKQQLENPDLKWAELDLPFKLLLDTQKQIIMRHNTFPYYPIPEVPVLISKPYVAVSFDEIPGIHFILLDVFRSRLHLSNVRLKISPFNMSSTYEDIYMGLQRFKNRKFMYEYWTKIEQRSGRRFIKGPFYTTISKIE